MQYSVLNIRETVGDFRIDAEAYLPKYLNNETILEKREYTTLRKEAKLLAKGIFDIKAECYLEKGGIPFIRIGDLGDVLLNDNYVRIPISENDKNIRTLLKKGDLVVSKTAYAAASLVSIESCNVSQDIIAIKLRDNSLVNSRYLAVFLNCSYGLLQMQRWFSGNIQSHLNLDDISTIIIPLLSNSFQRSIEKYVEQALVLKRESAELYFEAESILLSELGLADWKPKRQLAFVKNFSDTESADRIDSEYFQPMYDELIEIITNTSKAKPIGEYDFIQVTTGQYSKEYCDKTAGLPYIRGTDLLNGTVNMQGLVYIPREAQDETKIAQEGDVVVTRVGTIGLSARIPKECEGGTISDNLIRLRISGDELNSYYLALFLDSVLGRSLMIRNSRGSVQQRLNQETLKEIVVPILNRSIQKTLASKVEGCHKIRGESKHLLRIAERGVEIAIEQNEKEAIRWLNQEVKSLCQTM